MNAAVADTTTMLAALSYAARGWPVFPLKPREKTPATAHGVKDATTDEARIRGWWEKQPSANIGLATGHGLAVVDIDQLGSWTDLLDAADVPAPNTSHVETSRGWQLYFRTEAAIRNSASKLGQGIDVRGAGGYAVLPPSVHPSGHIYRWGKNGTPDELPDWLLDLLTRPKPPATATPRDQLPPGDETPYGRAALEAEAAVVAGAQEGSRRDRLNSAALKLGQLIAGGMVDEHYVRNALHDAALQAGLPEAEIRTTINNAIADGKLKPRSVRASTRATGQGVAHSGSTDQSKLTWHTLEDVDMRSIVFVDKPLLQADAFHLVAGRKGQGKGTLLANMAARVTCGELGSNRNVVWIGSEDSAAIDIKPRIVAAGGDPASVLIPKDRGSSCHATTPPYAKP